MGREIVYYLEAYNAEMGIWENLYLTTKEGKAVDFSGGKEGLDTIFGDDSKLDIPKRGLPKDFTTDTEWFEYERYCTWFDWCEFKALARTPEVEETDWWKIEETRPPTGYDDWLDVPEELRPHYNDFKNIVRKGNVILDAYGIYYPNPGEVRLVCCLSF